jgi:hypothetical protein
MNIIHTPPRPLPRYTASSPIAMSQNADHAAGARRSARGSRKVFRPAPHQRSEDAAAVQRKSGNEVEDRNHRVHSPEPDGRCGDDVDGARDECNAIRDERNSETRERSGDRDAKLHARRFRLTIDPRHAAEHEQRDAPYLEPVRERDPRMSELVNDDGREEEQTGQSADEPIDSGVPARIFDREIPDRERPGEKSECEQPADVHADRDPPDLRELHLTTRHRNDARYAASSRISSSVSARRGMCAVGLCFAGSCNHRASSASEYLLPM